MSAIPPKADIAEDDWDVRFVPEADIQEFGSHQKKNPGTLPGVSSVSQQRSSIEPVVDASTDDIGFQIGGIV